MPDLILHHYPSSPFSEKIRLILGFKDLAWKSVVIPVIMPKPEVVALTGGYRRTPILQIGADIYCDTALIADVLERLQPSPTLFPDGTEPLARTLAQWADATLFWTMIPYAMQPVGLQSLYGSAPPGHLQAFAADRKVFRSGAPRMSSGEATASLRLYLERLERMLVDGRLFLLGGEPTLADFSVFHSMWFIRRAGALAGILDGHAHLGRWIERIKAIGHGRSNELSSADAIAIAHSGVRMPVPAGPAGDAGGIAIGEHVIAAASDYGTDPVEGELVACTANEVTLRRIDPRAGTVFVHFPRIGFRVSPAA